MDVQDCLEYIFKKYEKKVDNPSIRIYVNKIEKLIKFKIKTRYYLKLITFETIKLLEISKNKITKDEIGENIPHLEMTEAVLVHYDNVNNDYQEDSRDLYAFVPNKSVG